MQVDTSLVIRNVTFGDNDTATVSFQLPGTNAGVIPAAMMTSMNLNLTTAQATELIPYIGKTVTVSVKSDV